jgi:hypothetical protein
MAELRRFFFELINQGIKNPVIIKRDYYTHSFDDVRLYSSTDFGGLLIDGLGDGVWLTSKSEQLDAEKTSRLTFVKESNENFLTEHFSEFCRQPEQEYQNRIHCLSIWVELFRSRNY